jgi:hypothetical protein
MIAAVEAAQTIAPTAAVASIAPILPTHCMAAGAAGTVPILFGTNIAGGRQILRSKY